MKTLADLKGGEIYFFNPKNKDLKPFKAIFLEYDSDNQYVVIKDLKFGKRKRFSLDFLENIEDVRE